MAMRVLAVLAAIGMIAGALYVRTEVLGASSDSGGILDGDDPPAADLQVACDQRLAGACPTGGQLMELGELIEAFSDRTTPLQAVVAPAVVVQMIEQSGRAQVTFGPARPVAARTPMAVVAAPAQLATLPDGCGDDPTWACISTAVTAGQLRPAFADPVSTSDGLAALAALAGGHFADSGGQFSRNGFSTGGFISWLSAVQRESSTSPAPATNLVRFGGAQNDSAIVPEADALDVLASGGAQSMGLVSVTPSPLAVLDVVVAGVAGVDDDDLEELAEEARQALQDAGWRGPDGSPPDGRSTAPALADDDGLPSGGVLVALQGRW